MFKLVYLLLLSAAYATVSVAQDNPAKLTKNPFGQPDFLKYKPPVKKTVIKKTTKKAIVEFTLSATFISVNGPMAIVNDILLSRGEEIDGMRLLMVGEGSAKIRYEGEIYILQINEPELDKTQKIKLDGLK